MSALCDPEEFRDALRKGLGRAVRHVHAAPAQLVREPLLDACVRYVGYDMMCEGSRVPWLYDMILCTGEPDWYCAETLKALEGVRDVPEDSRDLFQLIELLAVFALNDHPELKEILCRKILDFKMPDGSVFWSDLPAEIFGVDGLVAIARRYSLMEERDYAVSHGSYLLAEGDEKLGPPLAEALRSAERDDETLRAYLRDIATHRREEKEEEARDHPPASPGQARQRRAMEELLSSLEGSPKATERVWAEQEFRDEYFGLRNQFKWAASSPNRRFVAPRRFLEQAFERLLTEDDPGRQFCLLGAFADLPMPRFEPSILKLVDSPIQALRWAAATAFSRISAPEARAKGRELLEGKPDPDDWKFGFELLTGSGRAEDLPLIISTLNAVPARTMDAFDVHTIVWSALPLPKIGKPADSAPIMHWVYKNSPCANCRCKSVIWLVENRVAPDELLEECLDDCDEMIGDLALESLK